MAQEDADAAALAELAPRKGRRVLRKALLLLVLVTGALVLLAWFERYRIADNILARELARRGIEARYRIEAIDPTRQVLSDIVIGDPAAPDLTIERLVIRTRPRFGFPTVTAVGVLRPRLYGSWREGELSFGALDPLLFPEEPAEPFELPDLVLTIADGRALLASDYGPVGLRLAGSGHLRSGFAGEFAAAAPALAAGGCALSGTTLYGRLGIDAERPRFSGPLRFDRLACEDAGATLAGGLVRLELGADRALSGIDGEADLALGPLAIAGSRLAALSGEAEFTWRARTLTLRHELEGRGFAGGPARAALLESEGLLRARQDFARISLEGELSGRGLALGTTVERALAAAEDAAGGTPAGPLLARIRRQLAKESRGSTLGARYTVRLGDGRRVLLVPRAVLTGRSGAALLALTDGEAAAAGEGTAFFSGDFRSGGAGLPRITGRIAQAPSGAATLSLAMEEYRAGEGAGAASLALPELELTRAADGSIGLAGRVRASGPLPGGAVRALELPLAGGWSEGGGLSLWPGCTRLRFDALELADLALEQQALVLCPPRGAPILRHDARGLAIAAGAPSLDLAGRIGSTPVAIASGPVGFAWPGTLSARRLAIALGPAETASHFAVADLTADLSREIGGRFEGADVRLAAVPLDLIGASGTWRYADGRLALADGGFTLADRQPAPRFHPLVARDAALALEDNVITAEAALREPGSGALVTELAIRHDLASGTGHADLAVPRIAFGDRLQPTDLTPLAFGVVALVDGSVTGSGRIDWNEAGIASTGRFSSGDLDFAAAFGPVEGASGTVEFTELIGLTTAPGQRIAMRSVNPGIEINDGEVTFRIRGGEFIDLEGARWPFLGGTLTMRPLTIAIGVEERRGYVLDIVGIEAAKFVERIELDNIAATGTLDGTIPIVFDADGNGRLEGGFLASRPPGGNVAYVGQLTYEDLTPVANFAFDMLRSLDYRHMRIAMNGPLTGELVTQVALEGVSQGADIERNIITRRLAQIPVRLVVNVRAPFYQLLSSVRSLYDPSAVRDPRELGLIDPGGGVIRRETGQAEVDQRDAARQAAEEESARRAAETRDIQPPESEPVP